MNIFLAKSQSRKAAKMQSVFNCEMNIFLAKSQSRKVAKLQSGFNYEMNIFGVMPF